MAAAFYHKNQAEKRQNGKNSMDSAVASRVKSVSNIAKRSAGLGDDDDIDLNPLNLNTYDNEQRHLRSQDSTSGSKLIDFIFLN